MIISVLEFTLAYTYNITTSAFNLTMSQNVKLIQSHCASRVNRPILCKPTVRAWQLHGLTAANQEREHDVFGPLDCDSSTLGHCRALLSSTAWQNLFYGAYSTNCNSDSYRPCNICHGTTQSYYMYIDDSTAACTTTSTILLPLILLLVIAIGLSVL